jgi:hypothetical protein
MLFHLRIVCLLLVPAILSTALVLPAPALPAAGELRARAIVPAQPPALELAAHIPGPIRAYDCVSGDQLRYHDFAHNIGHREPDPSQSAREHSSGHDDA